MKLVFVNRFFFPDHSATSQMLTDIAFGLAERGREVHVITSRYGYEGGLLAHRNEETVRGVRIHRVASTRFGRRNLWGRAADYASFVHSVRGIVRQLAGPGDIFVAKTDPPMLSAAIAGPVRAKGAYLINWVQDLFPEVAEQAGISLAKGPWMRFLRRTRDKALSVSIASVAVGEGMSERLLATGSAPNGTVHVIHNFADGSAIVPLDAENSALRRDLGLSGKFVVGYSGNFGRVHEFDTVLGAAVALRDHPAIRFLFVGAGNQLGHVRETIAREKLDNVVMAPYQPRERLAESLAAADVHVCSLSPQFEGLVVPSKIYGIMAANRPCLFIGDRHGEVARIIERGRFGVCIGPGEIGQLVAAIESLAIKPEDGRALGRAGRIYFEKEFDLPIALRQWEDLLDGLDSGRV